jgi:hypothetical protein
VREDRELAVGLDWIEAHCVIPDGFRRGRPFALYDFQLEYLGRFYLVRGTATWNPDDPVLGPAFTYRRGLLVDPQKKGKGPLSAAHICLEGAGPALFAGWAGRDDGYACSEHGCSCGWEYPYEPGEPMGMHWPTPLIQVTALSEEQTDNIYGALRPMIDLGPLSDLIPRTGEEFIRLPGGGRIDTVTSSAQSRLGQRVTFVPQDEVGLWTPSNRMTKVADTQYRGLAGMGGRASLTTNAWDPSERSVAQQQFESQAKDIYRQFRQPPANLSYRNKVERRRIHRFVYGEALKERGGHVDLDSIEAEAADLLERDPAQAERFFGNRIVYGAGAWLREGLWDSKRAERGDRTLICLAFDGSLNNDWTCLRAETIDGYQFTPSYGPDHRPAFWDPAQWGGEIPRGEVRAAVDEIFSTFEVQRSYWDPEDWESEIDQFALLYGEARVLQWRTNRMTQMYEAIRRFETDLITGLISHDDCPTTAVHIANARKVAKPGQKYVLGKPNESQKIDLAMATVLVHEAAADARAAGWSDESDDSTVLVFR